MLKVAQLALFVAFAPAVATAIDPVAVTLTSPAEVTATRAALIVETWGTTTLPTSLPIVTAIADPFGKALPNVGAVYNYHAAMSNGQVNDSSLYMNAKPNGTVVILNMGHMGTADWPAFPSTSNTVPMMTALLNAGFSIYAMNMPFDGQCCSEESALFTMYGNVAMQYFLEPAVQAMNYWDAHSTFSHYDFVGLSGGGWTGVVLQAIDTRVRTLISDAGSLPGTQFCCAGAPIQDLPNLGDTEQHWAPFYSIAGYMDLYVMGASGPGRSQVQILNINDTCCFGPLEWNSYYAAANDGRTWYQQVDYYTARLKDADAAVPSNISVVQDTTATQHQISNPYAVDLALNTLLAEQEDNTSVPEPEATGSSSGGGDGGGGGIDALTLGTLFCSLLLALRRTQPLAGSGRQ